MSCMKCFIFIDMHIAWCLDVSCDAEFFYFLFFFFYIKHLHPPQICQVSFHKNLKNVSDILFLLFNLLSKKCISFYDNKVMRLQLTDFWFVVVNLIVPVCLH